MTYRDPFAFATVKPELHGQRGRVLKARIERHVADIVAWRVGHATVLQMIDLCLLAVLLALVAVATGHLSLRLAMQGFVWAFGVLMLFVLVDAVNWARAGVEEAGETMMDYLDHLRVAGRLDGLELQNKHMRYVLAQRGVYEAAIKRAEAERLELLAAIEAENRTQDGTDQE
jgi:hypothetical protein